MISLCNGCELNRFLLMLEGAPERFTQVIICSPFIDSATSARIRRLAARAVRVGCGIRVITQPNLALGLGVGPLTPFARGMYRGMRQLHAKVYLAVARRFRESVLIITSANMTAAGLRRNYELGVLVQGTTPAGSQLVDIARNMLVQLGERN